MRNIAIYGAGGFGREMALMIRQINQAQLQWNVVGYFDDGKSKGTDVGGIKVLGGYEALCNHREEISIAVAIADPLQRRELVQKIDSPLIDFPVLVHPACHAGDPINHIERGCILTAGTILTTAVTMRQFVVVNLQSTIGHDVELGQFTTVMPGCSVSGNVKVGGETLIGTGARILQNLSIGRNCVVGAGAVVTRNFGDHKTLMGIPANEK
ncbi:MAG TPA: NeuD/PglB/VioB family sugar acetyltransferase [Cyclobacteriaceae bacterium]|nr:NeuD/PglB/VioB family sugar acetyltransferase [Cyclobacteriaceae bacterium]